MVQLEDGLKNIKKKAMILIQEMVSYPVKILK